MVFSHQMGGSIATSHPFPRRRQVELSQMAQDAAEALHRAQQELQQPQLGPMEWGFPKSCRVPFGNSTFCFENGLSIYIYIKHIYIYSPYSDLLIQMVIFHMLVYQRIPGSIRLDI